jgi:hypothetical protein
MAKEHQFNLRLDDDVRESLSRLAAHYGLTAAQVVRNLIVQEANAVAATTDDHRLVLSIIRAWFAAGPTFQAIPVAQLVSPPFTRDARAYRRLFPNATLSMGLAPILDDLVRWRFLRLCPGPSYAPTNKQGW